MFRMSLAEQEYQQSVSASEPHRGTWSSTSVPVTSSPSTMTASISLYPLAAVVSSVSRKRLSNCPLGAFTGGLNTRAVLLMVPTLVL